MSYHANTVASRYSCMFISQNPFACYFLKNVQRTLPYANLWVIYMTLTFKWSAILTYLQVYYTVANGLWSVLTRKWKKKYKSTFMHMSWYSIIIYILFWHYRVMKNSRGEFEHASLGFYRPPLNPSTPKMQVIWIPPETTNSLLYSCKCDNYRIIWTSFSYLWQWFWNTHLTFYLCAWYTVLPIIQFFPLAVIMAFLVIPMLFVHNVLLIKITYIMLSVMIYQPVIFHRQDYIFFDKYLPP